MIQVSKWLIPALGALALSAATPAAHAVTTTPVPIQDDDPQEELEWLQEEYSNAYSPWLQKYTAAEESCRSP